jgi:hypothetical protein
MGEVEQQDDTAIGAEGTGTEGAKGIKMMKNLLMPMSLPLFLYSSFF